MNSTKHPRNLFIVAVLMIVPILLQAQVDGGRQKVGREILKKAESAPRITRGAPYPAVTPPEFPRNMEAKRQIIPTGKLVGDMKPANKAIYALDGRKKYRPDLKKLNALSFKDYREQTNSIPAASGCCPEVSVAENGQTIMTTGNTWMALSTNGGVNFNSINPSTIFPQDDGGFCCDQVVHYIPKYDIFVWLLQYR